MTRKGLVHTLNGSEGSQNDDRSRKDAEKMITAAIDDPGWRFVSYPLATTESSTSSVWTLAKPPPKAPIYSSVFNNTSALEWGAPATIQEIYDIETLSEFKSTMISLPTSRHARALGKRKAIPGDVDDYRDNSERVRKRQRGHSPSRARDRDALPIVPRTPITATPVILVPNTISRGAHSSSSISSSVIDLVPLDSIIPIPHCIRTTSSRSPFTLSNDARLQVPPYPIHIIIPNPRNSSTGSSSSEGSWNRRYSRGAWVIPINSVQHHYHPSASSASLVHPQSINIPSSSELGPSSPRDGLLPSQGEHHIYWTPSSLKSFWSLLKRVRLMKRFGPIGIYFEREDLVHFASEDREASLPMAPSASASSLALGSTSTPRPERNGIGGGLHESAKASSATRGRSEPRRAWIKLYCETSAALYLRTVIAHFKAADEEPQSDQSGGDATSDPIRETPDSGGASGGPRTSNEKQVTRGPRKILFGAKLVFLDEMGEPAIIS